METETESQWSKIVNPGSQIHDFVESSSILSDKEIEESYDRKEISIYPFNKSNIGNCSYDVRLGNYFYRTNSETRSLFPWNKESVVSYWIGPFNSRDTKYQIQLRPGETILAHTNEYIGGINNITTMIKTRSSLKRLNIDICGSAGWGDVGYINRYTLEITNSGPCEIYLSSGGRIGQVVFLRTGPIKNSYQGKYQKLLTLDELRSEWEPKKMLPRTYDDWELKEGIKLASFLV